MTKGERDEAMTRALLLSVRGKPYTDIAEELGVSWPTAKKLVEDAIAVRGEHESVEAERQRALAHYDEIIAEGWRRLASLKDSRSYNASALLNSIKAAQDSKNKVTGAEAPIRFKDETGEPTEIVFDDDEITAETGF